MKKILLLVAVIAALFVSVKVVAERIVPSKHYVTKKVEVGSFDGISTGSSVDVIYTQTSGSQDVQIYASDNLIDYIKVGVEDGILTVRFKSPNNNFSINGSHKMEVRVSAPAVHSLRASSSGDIILKNGLNTSGTVYVKSGSSGDVIGGKISADEIEITANSSGDVTFEELTCKTLNASTGSSGDVVIKNISCTQVIAEASSSGDMRLSGVCRDAEFSASSSGDLNAKELKAAHVTATASSSGDVSCYATEVLKAKTSSAGDIAYKGNPKQIDFSPKRGLHKID